MQAHLKMSTKYCHEVNELLVPLMLSTHQVPCLPTIPSFCLLTLMTSIPQSTHNGTSHRNVFWRLSCCTPPGLSCSAEISFVYMPSQLEMTLQCNVTQNDPCSVWCKTMPNKDKLGKYLFKCCTNMKQIISVMPRVQICFPYLFQYRSILDWIYKEPDVKLKKLVLIFSTYNKKFDKLKVIHTNLNASLN